MSASQFTPREIVGELDRYIIGQGKAKRAVAIALRNRWRRQQVEGDLREEIAPRNIIMIGPTGVGKTEIARRLAKLARAPFVKVEASKFTEVGYVGRDVESMVRDLIENGLQIVREEARADVEVRAREQAEKRLIGILKRASSPVVAEEVEDQSPSQSQQFGPFVFNMPGVGAQHRDTQVTLTESEFTDMRKRLRAGEFDEEEVELDVRDNSNPFISIFGNQGNEEMEINIRDMMSQATGGKTKTKRRKLKVPQALKALSDEEAEKLIDEDKVQREAIRRTEQDGIVFLDEIDKIASSSGRVGGPDVSREGVQRDLLPIVEGSTVSTKYGQIKTDHVLFIAAGAFHVSKVSDLIPELQGRFPIRVELDSLEKEDFVRILKEPKTALTKQYQSLMKTEGVELDFMDSGIDAIAHYATEANRSAENIGARRLYTVMEALLEQLSFEASERGGDRVQVDDSFVRQKLDPIVNDQELAKYIL